MLSLKVGQKNAAAAYSPWLWLQWIGSVPFYVSDQRVISRDKSDVIFWQDTITSCWWPNIYFYLFSSIAVSCWSITPNHLPLPHSEQTTHVAMSIDYWVPEIIITIRFCKILLIDFTPTLRINLIFLLQLLSIMMPYSHKGAWMLQRQSGANTNTQG